MKRYIFLMMLMMAGSGAEAMDYSVCSFDLMLSSGMDEGRRNLSHNPLRLAIQWYPENKKALTLLKKGADPNEKDLVDTPLSDASSKEQIELMLSYGAEPKKMKQSGLCKVIIHYFFLKNRYKPSNVSNEQWRNEAFEAMDLLLKHGESIKKRDHGDVGLHVISGVIDHPIFPCDSSDRKPLLSFLIARGSNPNEVNEVNLRHPDFSESDYSIYQMCQRNFPQLEKFMRKERGWYLTWPLFLMTHISKKTDGDGTEVWDYKQPSECAMRALPRDLVREIAKYLLHWKHGE